MKYRITHNDQNADPMRRPKTRRRHETPRWPSSLKEKVRRRHEKPEAGKKGGAR